MARVCLFVFGDTHFKEHAPAPQHSATVSRWVVEAFLLGRLAAWVDTDQLLVTHVMHTVVDVLYRADRAVALNDLSEHRRDRLGFQV